MSGVDEDRVRSLLDCRKQIQSFLWEKREELQALRSTKSVEDTDWVIELADNLTMSTRAPTHWAPPRPLHEFKGHPPAPQFEQMRAGWLEKYHQKRLKNMTGKKGAPLEEGSGKEKDSALKLLKFERTESSRRPSIESKHGSKRGREEDEEDNGDEDLSKRKRSRGDSFKDEAEAKKADALGGRKATGLSFGLDASDSDSDSD